MPLLLYAVTDCAGELLDLPSGVAGAIVQSMGISSLVCFYSEYSTVSDTRQTALDFHRVVHCLLQKIDIIPFRFPTLLAHHAEIAREIEEHAAEYRDGLAKVRGCLQIEISIRLRVDDGRPWTRGTANSGAEYLRSRQHRHRQLKSAAEALRAAAGDLVERWQEREYSDHLRCFALIPRASLALIHEQMAGADISSDLVARVSGPWPPTEFLKTGVRDEQE
jgi:Gas vesicle synthesis protein GvpL/GvpF